MDSCKDGQFGPLLAAAHCRYGGLDFTLFFEAIFFQCLPNAIFILSYLAVTTTRFRRLRWRPQCTRHAWKAIIQLSLALALLGAQVVSLATWIRVDSQLQIEAILAASSLDVVSAALICISSQVEVPAGTTIVSSFLFVWLLLDTVRIRSLSALTSSTERLIVTIIVCFSLKICLLTIGCYNSTRNSHDNDATIRGRNNVLADSLMLWLTPLFRHGYHNSVRLQQIPKQPEQLLTALVAPKAAQLWSSANPAKKHALACTIFWLARKTLLMQMVPRLCLMGFSISQPFLIRRFLAEVSGGAKDSNYFLVAAFAIVYIGIAISTMWYQVLTVRTITLMRGALINLIYAKTWQLSSNDLLDSPAVSLLTADVERISTSIEYVQNFWADIIQIGLATYVLSIYISGVCVAAILVALFSSIAAGYVGNMIGPRQRTWFEKGRDRIRSTTSLLDDIQGVKWSGLESEVQKNISHLRAEQISAQKKFRRVQILIITLGNFPSIVTPFVVFLAFALSSQISSYAPLPLADMFAALSVLSLLIGPVSEIVGILPNFSASLSCFATIQDYLRKDTSLCNLAVEKQITETSETIGADVPQETDLREKDCPIYAQYDHVSVGLQCASGRQHILTDLSFRIPRGRLTIITGPTGSGKSTLLRSICRDLTVSSGEAAVQANNKIGFCHQSPWIMNATIRENIVGGSNYDETWYAIVLGLCCLTAELRDLSEGDQTVIGSKGGSLSGGQIARIALARAVYSRALTIILDEPFSSLDSATENKCFSRLLGRVGLLTNSFTTVILATSSRKWLEDASYVISLDADGKAAPNQTAQDDGEVDTISGVIPEETSIKNLPSEAISAPDTKADVLTTSPRAHQSNTAESSEPPAVPRMKDMRLVPFYLKTMSRWIFIALLSMMLIQVTLISIQPLWLNFWIEYNEKNPNRGTAYYFGIYFALVLGGLGLLSACASVFFLILVPLSSQSLHDQLITSTLTAPLSFFQQTKTGTILNHFTQDLILVDMALPLALLLALENGMSSLLQLILVSISTGYVALAIPGILLALFIVQHVYLRTSKQIRLLDLAAKAPIYDHLTETISGITTIRLMKWQALFTAKNHKVVDDSQKAYYIMLCIQKWLGLVLNLVVAGLAVLLTATIVALRGQVSSGLLGVSLVSVVGLGEKLSYFITYWTSLETSLGAISRIKSYSDNIAAKYDASEQKEANTNWPQNGDIQMIEVSVGYSTSTVLHDINCEIPQGQKVKISGPSGSGKTSFVAILLQLIDVQRGTVFIDGEDISKLNRQSLHRAVFALPQTLCFVSSTIRGNLVSRIQHSVTDEELERVLKSVGLWDRVCSLPNGLETEWTAELLSQGQKQLFGFAQALLSNCPIIILDEISSYLDNDTVAIIQQLLASEFQGRTTLMITHDIRDGFTYDRAIRLENGGIVSDERV